jgi:hypothetical protein
MKLINQLTKAISVEIFVLFAYIFLVNNYIGNVQNNISADGVGYYDYLPSLFIHNDLVRKDLSIQKDTAFFSRINSLSAYVNYENGKVNKYPCGTAILEFPFFAYTYLISDLKNNNDKNGYQYPFHKAIYYAALVYLFLSIIFLKKLLDLYQIKKYIIFFSQLLLVLATNITNYTNLDASFSHIYSLFAITAFFFFVKSYFLNKKLNHFIYACLFFGLIILLRQVNIITILFVPFLAGSFLQLKTGIVHILYNPKKLLLGLFLILTTFSIQSIFWYLQTGHLFVYSYQGEGFNFFKPEFSNILFSYKKGLFIYTPILLISLLGLIWLIYHKKYYLFFTWTFFFIFLTYILSSWWSWYYGCSYGLRAYIDFFSMFFIIYALMLNAVNLKIKSLLIILSIITIPINIIQTYQYKEFILDWINMDKDKYWKVFLKTDNKYKGLLWKKTIEENQYKIIKEIKIGNFTTKKNIKQIVYKLTSSDIYEFNKITFVQILIDNNFNEQNNTELFLNIYDTIKPKQQTPYHTHLIQFAEKQFNTTQTGIFNFEISPSNDTINKTISLEINSKNDIYTLKNIKLKFLSKND